MEEANAYLPAFMDDFNHRFAKPPKCDTNAHRELTKAHPSECTVTYIALQNGFNHLGRFSVDFYKRFGQSPRDVLSMQAGHNS